jgi:ribulose kinase
MGAAIDAAVGLKLHPNFETAIHSVVRWGQTFEPNLSNHTTDDELYHNVYQHMYAQLRPLYKAIQDRIKKTS